MLESMLVGLIVVVATGYAVWALTPAVSRNRFALRLAHGLGGAEAPGLRGRAATWLQKLAQSTSGRMQRLPGQYVDACRARAEEGSAALTVKRSPAAVKSGATLSSSHRTVVPPPARQYPQLR